MARRPQEYGTVGLGVLLVCRYGWVQLPICTGLSVGCVGRWSEVRLLGNRRKPIQPVVSKGTYTRQAHESDVGHLLAAGRGNQDIRATQVGQPSSVH